MNYADIIMMEPGKRSGKPCIRGLRITVYDVLENLASGMSHAQILQEFPYLTEQDIRAGLAFAADPQPKFGNAERVTLPTDSLNRFSAKP
jgi:uncharacterized protein (DUF433 family)